MSPREKGSQINADFKRLLGDRAEIINCGSAPNSGEGDTVSEGLAKIHRNLERLMKEVGEVNTNDCPKPVEPGTEFNRWAVGLLKSKFIAWRVPAVDLPADSVIEDVVAQIARRAQEGQQLKDKYALDSHQG